MSSGRVGLKRYIIPITFDIFKPMWSMCLLHCAPLALLCLLQSSEDIF